MIVQPMRAQDRDYVLRVDRHMSADAYDRHVYAKTGYVLWEDGVPAGLMHHCVLWDSLPILNLIFVEEAYRHRGFASQALAFWEADMKRQGYPVALVSTQVDEGAQHLYRRLGYQDCGGLLLDHTPMAQPMELFMRKVL